MVCLHMNQKVHVACNFICVVEAKGLSSEGHRQSTYTGNILEGVQDRDVVTTDD